MNIYDTPVTLYKGNINQPDGTKMPFSFCTAFLSADDDVYGHGGEYLIMADDNGNLFQAGTVGNAAMCEDSTEYESYCAMMLAEKGV